MDPDATGWKLVVPEEHKERVENVRDLVREHNEQAQERQAKAFDQGKRDKTHKVGQDVIRKVYYLSNAEKGMAGKLFTKFEGPYKFLEVLSPATYLLDWPSHCLKLTKVHSNQFKPYIPSLERARKYGACQEIDRATARAYARSSPALAWA